MYIYIMTFSVPAMLLQTCDLKVNTCCEECASKVKEKLQELNGTYKLLISLLLVFN